LALTVAAGSPSWAMRVLTFALLAEDVDARRRGRA
jgi:hypothetical protein